MSEDIRKMIDNVKNFKQFVNENINDKTINSLILTQDFVDKVNNILKDTFDDYDVRYSNNISGEKGSKVSLKSLDDDRTVDIIYDVDTKRKRYRWKFKGDNF